MKKFLLILVLLVSVQTFSQISDVKYFGGIYEKQLYFNVVFNNVDSCYFIVEFSYDGRVYRELFCDSVKPVPLPIIHCFQMSTNNTQLWVRMTVMTGNKIIDFQSEVFEKEKYTYAPIVSVIKSRTVHGNF